MAGSRPSYPVGGHQNALITYPNGGSPTPATWRAAQGVAPAARRPGARVGVLASGGLSHFVVDEELDRKVLADLAVHSPEAFSALADRAKEGLGVG